MIKSSILIVLLSALSLGAFEINPKHFSAKSMRSGALVRVDSSQTLSEEMLAGAVVDVKASRQGDLSVFGADVSLSGDVSGDLVAMGAVLKLSGDVSGKADVGGASVYLDGTYADTLEVGAAVMYLNGHVKGPVTLSGAVINIGKDAVIEQKLRYSCAELVVDSSAQLLGGKEFFEHEKEKPRGEVRIRSAHPLFRFGRWMIGNVLGLLFFLGAGFLLVLISSWNLRKVTDHLMQKPGQSALAGGIALAAFPMVLLITLALLASVIGTAAGIFILALYGIGFVFSIVYAGTTLGRFILSRASKGKEPHIVLSMMLGVFIAFVLCRIPFVGFFVSLAVFVFGFGAFLGRRFSVMGKFKEGK